MAHKKAGGSSKLKPVILLLDKEELNFIQVKM